MPLMLLLLELCIQLLRLFCWRVRSDLDLFPVSIYALYLTLCFITSYRFYLFYCVFRCVLNITLACHFQHVIISCTILLSYVHIVKRDRTSCGLLLKWWVPLHSGLSFCQYFAHLYLWYLCLRVICARMLFVLTYLCLCIVHISTLLSPMHCIYAYMLYVLTCVSMCYMCFVYYVFCATCHCIAVACYIVNASLFQERPCWN